MRPPDDSALRARALTSADRLLSASGRQGAADELALWTGLVLETSDGPLGWLANRTVIPHGLYVKHLATAVDSTEQTVRMFASQCIARMDPGVRSWAAAAEALEMPPAMGKRTARASSARMLVDHDEWARRLQSVVGDLARVNYRDLEQQVRHRTYMSRWFDEWARRCRPESHWEARTYALIWQWEHIAHGHVDLAPAWREHRPAAKDRALYRQFEATLSHDQQSELRYALYKRA